MERVDGIWKVEGRRDGTAIDAGNTVLLYTPDMKSLKSSCLLSQTGNFVLRMSNAYWKRIKRLLLLMYKV